ncbi:DNA polymerase III subunit gamma and tau [Leifsonella bigeumensis]|uniref:DNA polymerase III subunit gamma and tau n=1 Tax=Leifsonella bigeumensis TaxID=433643 RepID=UPI0031DE116E
MVTALYRRYRPETFAELIGQSQVTEPLMTALRTNRVNHAYLFSGPRGCGKTTSARILARCLNCVEGPTDTPCGKCPSCVELSRDGGGSLDVVEIDAASHNGVDDARDLRERAVFAPARDRYKIFILDEAHMVTPQGFNALLKIVEEPPEHVKFIFATTEPEKVIGTIRSRTHHYPFRLVPPAQMLEYVQQLCESEKVTVAPGVLPLVVRAGGGSVRDTLSLLDQLIAGSEGDSIEYERAVALLGYTHASLLGEVIDAIGARDAAAAFSAVDRVIQTGQDPRRFVEDLLERLRDLIVVAATGGGAAAVLRGIQQDELDQMAAQASRFGEAELSRAADVVAGALTEMTGATSPRLHLELMIARVLVPASDASARGTLARVERLERRVGVEGGAGDTPVASRGNPTAETAVGAGVAGEGEKSPSPRGSSAPVDARHTRGSTPLPDDSSSADSESPLPEEGGARHEGSPEKTPATSADKAVTFQQLSDAWAEILEVVGKKKRAAWAVAFTAKPMGLKEDVLALAFPSQNDVENFKKPQAADQSVSEILRQAIIEVLGLRVKFIARADAAAANAADAEPDAPPAEPGPDRSTEVVPEPRPAVDAEGWAVAPIPSEKPASTPVEPGSRQARSEKTGARSERVPVEPASSPVEPPASPVEPPASPVEPVETAEPRSRQARSEKAAKSAPSGGKQRYGEAVVREILGANFIEEQPIAPRVTPSPEA